MKKVFKNTTAADRILFLLLLVFSVSGLFIREAMPRPLGVVVEVDGRPAYTFPLDADRTVSIGGPYGPTVVEIKDRKVRVMESHCSNQICVKEGWVSKGAIVCLPNRIVVFVGGSSDRGEGVDAVSR